MFICRVNEKCFKQPGVAKLQDIESITDFHAVSYKYGCMYVAICKVCVKNLTRVVNIAI